MDYTNNMKYLKVEMQRLDLVNLILACNACALSEGGANKWGVLADKLKEQLDKFDEKLKKV